MAGAPRARRCRRGRGRWPHRDRRRAPPARPRPSIRAVPEGASTLVAVVHLDDLDVPILAEVRDRDFRLVAGSVGLSAFGDWVAIVALGLQVKEMTGAGLEVAALWICLFGPSVALAAHAGLLVDRVETTRLLAVVSAVGAAVALAAGFFAGSALGGAARPHRAARRDLRRLPAGGVRARAAALRARSRAGGQRPRRDRALHRLRPRSAGRRRRLRGRRARPRDGDRRAHLRARRDRGDPAAGEARSPRGERRRSDPGAGWDRGPARRPRPAAGHDRRLQLAAVHVRGLGGRALLRRGRARPRRRRLRAHVLDLDGRDGARRAGHLPPRRHGRGRRDRAAGRRRPGPRPGAARRLAGVRVLPASARSPAASPTGSRT